MMLCQLNARRAAGDSLTQNEVIIAESYGKGEEVDINAESLEFDIAALLGKVVSGAVTQSRGVQRACVGFGSNSIIILRARQSFLNGIGLVQLFLFHSRVLRMSVTINLSRALITRSRLYALPGPGD